MVRNIIGARRPILASAPRVHRLSGTRSTKTNEIPEIPFEPPNFVRLHLEVLANHAKLESPIYAQSVGGTKIVWICDPAMCESVFRSEGHRPVPVLPDSWLEYNKVHQVRRGLLFQDGSEWETTRSKMNPIFLKNSDFKRHLDVVRGDLIRRLSKQEGLESVVHPWSVQNVLAALFGKVYLQQRDSYRLRIKDLIDSNDKMMEASVELQNTAVAHARQQENPDYPHWLKFERESTKMLDISGEIIHTLVDQKCEGEGMVGALADCFNNEMFQRVVKDLLIAAADTTSYSTLWTLHLLASHPEIQEKARKSCQSLQSPHVRRAIKESLRLFPVAPFVSRMSTREMRITSSDDRTFVILPGSRILMSTYAMGRDPRFFPDPDRFHPDRWDRELSARLPGSAFAVLPFGFGPRRCIGKTIADYSMEALIVDLLSQCKMTSHGEVNYVMRLIGVPDRKIPISFKFFRGHYSQGPKNNTMENFAQN